MFELVQLQHRVQTIWLAHSQYHVLPPMTISARRIKIILVRVSQDVVIGPTKSCVLSRCAESVWPIKYRLYTRFLSKHDVNVNVIGTISDQ